MRFKNETVIFLWPLARHILTQGMYSSTGKWHGAIDMRSTWDGTTIQPVYAAEDGTVNWVQDWDGKTITGMQSYGNAVKIRHADYKGLPLETRYAHLSSYLVEKGKTVKEGQLIGYTGNTGNSSGAHLHFEVILNGERRNPLVWLSGDFEKAWDTVYTYGPGEGPAKQEEEERNMTYTSDTLKIGPVSTGDRTTMKALAAQLGAAARDEGDYLLIGPMGEEARDKVAEKAAALALGCLDYTAPAQTDLTPVLDRLDSQDKELAEIKNGITTILDKLDAAGKALG